MSLNLILSKINFFLKSTFSFIKSKKHVEAEELDKKKKRGFLRFIFDHILRRIIILKNKKKINSSKVRSKKQLSKNIQKKTIEEKNTKYDSMSLDKNVTHLEKLIQNYEEFIKRDLFAIIIEANANLRKWRSDLVEMMSKGNELQKAQMLGLSTNLQEISELYIDTQKTLDLVSNKFSHYQEIIKDTKRAINPQQKLNQLQSQLDRVILGLEKGKYIADLSHNNDYKYLYKYVYGKNDNGRSISF